VAGDVLRDQGFLKGFGIDIKEPTDIGDEDDPRIVGHDVTEGSEEGGRHRHGESPADVGRRRDHDRRDGAARNHGRLIAAAPAATATVSPAHPRLLPRARQHPAAWVTDS
jgi:hypothetical protein